jgi:hypothetical protein
LSGRPPEADDVAPKTEGYRGLKMCRKHSPVNQSRRGSNRMI